MSEMKTVGELLKDAFKDKGFWPHIPEEPGDYVAEDGFLHCGKCRTRKECTFPLSGRMVPCMCDCRKAEVAAEEERKLRQQQRDRVRELFNYSLIDELFYECTFENYTVRDEQDAILLKRLRNYAENFDVMYQRNKGLLLYGPPGTGKTFGANCIANYLMEQGIPVMVTSIVKLTTGRVFEDDLRHTLNIMKNARLLILDDLGAERNTETKSEQIFDIIDTRISSNKPMIITSNITDFKSETDIRRRRVYDRITKACIPLRVDGESRRRQAAMAEHKDLMSILDQ